MNLSRKQLTEKLLKLIRGLKLDANGKLPSERELAGLLNVSRTMLREALISLEALGVIEMRGREGLFLISTNSEEIKNIIGQTNVCPVDILAQILQIRLILEPVIAKNAASQRTQYDVLKLEHCLKELERADDSNSPADAASWNTVLHVTIVNAIHNTMLSSFYQHLIERMQNACSSLRTEIMGTTPEFTQSILHQHQQTVKAIAEKDGERAYSLSEEHIVHTVKGLISSNQLSAISEVLKQQLKNEFLS